VTGSLGLLIGCLMMIKVFRSGRLKIAIVVISLEIMQAFLMLSWAFLDTFYQNDDPFAYRITFNFLFFLQLLGCYADYFVAFEYLK
jgi:hypothetical protein